MTEPRPWRVPVMVAQIPERGLRLDLVADADTRARLAAAAGLRTLPEAAAEVTLMPAGDGKVRVTGRVRAVVGQTCVVTLEPVDNTVDETFEALFAPGDDAAASATESDDGGAGDPPEPIPGGVIDVGSLVTDYLFLGIDPYPRKPGAAFAPVEAAPDPADHPFAALGTLKAKPSPDRSGNGNDPGRDRGPRRRS